MDDATALTAAVKARDGDGDGFVYDDTPRMRPVIPGVDTVVPKRPRGGNPQRVADTVAVKRNRVGNVDSDRLRRRRARLVSDISDDTVTYAGGRLGFSMRAAELTVIESELERRGELARRDRFTVTITPDPAPEPTPKRTVYHLTDAAQFKLNPKKVPADNALAINERTAPGLYVAKDRRGVETWVNGYGYLRPFVVELDVPEDVLTDERWGNEGFIPAEHFDKVEVKRVIPTDAFARETYNDYGWVETELGSRFDDGMPVPERRLFQAYEGLPAGWRYEGPDVRDMAPAEVKRLKDGARIARRSLSSGKEARSNPFAETLEGGETAGADGQGGWRKYTDPVTEDDWWVVELPDATTGDTVEVRARSGRNRTVVLADPVPGRPGQFFVDDDATRQMEQAATARQQAAGRPMADMAPTSPDRSFAADEVVQMALDANAAYPDAEDAIRSGAPTVRVSWRSDSATGANGVLSVDLGVRDADGWISGGEAGQTSRRMKRPGWVAQRGDRDWLEGIGRKWAGDGVRVEAARNGETLTDNPFTPADVDGELGSAAALDGLNWKREAGDIAEVPDTYEPPPNGFYNEDVATSDYVVADLTNADGVNGSEPNVEGEKVLWAKTPEGQALGYLRYTLKIGEDGDTSVRIGMLRTNPEFTRQGVGTWLTEALFALEGVDYTEVDASFTGDGAQFWNGRFGTDVRPNDTAVMPSANPFAETLDGGAADNQPAPVEMDDTLRGLLVQRGSQVDPDSLQDAWTVALADPDDLDAIRAALPTDAARKWGQTYGPDAVTAMRMGKGGVPPLEEVLAHNARRATNSTLLTRDNLGVNGMPSAADIIDADPELAAWLGLSERTTFQQLRTIIHRKQLAAIMKDPDPDPAAVRYVKMLRRAAQRDVSRQGGSVKLYRADTQFTGDPFRTKGGSGISSWTSDYATAAKYARNGVKVHEADVSADRVLAFDTFGLMASTGFWDFSGRDSYPLPGREVIVAPPEMLERLDRDEFPLTVAESVPVALAAAIDGDGDGFVNDGTPQMRPVGPQDVVPNLPKLSRQRPAVRSRPAISPDRRNPFAEQADAVETSYQSTSPYPGMRPVTPDERKALRVEGRPIPPAWTDVYVATDPDAAMRARGVDAKGRHQYIYSAAHEARAAAAKYERTKVLAGRVGALDAALERDAMNDPAAAATALIRHFGLRPGSTADTKARKKAYGATTLQARHVKQYPDTGRTTLSFMGKSGQKITVSTRDPAIYDLLDRWTAGKTGTTPLFDTSDALVRLYVQRHLGDEFTTKDLRTLHANVLALDMVSSMRRPTTLAKFKQARNKIADAVAKALGNTRAVTLSNYIDPTVFAPWEGALPA